MMVPLRPLWGAQTRSWAHTRLFLDLGSDIRRGRMRGHGILKKPGGPERVS
jgi:hypothetical protein